MPSTHCSIGLICNSTGYLIQLAELAQSPRRILGLFSDDYDVFWLAGISNQLLVPLI